MGNDGSGAVHELAGGIGVLRRSSNARVIVVVMAVTAALTGIAQNIVASMATDLLHIGAVGTPVLIGAVGVGGLVGGLASLSLDSRSLSLPLIMGLLSCGIVFFFLAATRSWPLPSRFSWCSA